MPKGNSRKIIGSLALSWKTLCVLFAGLLVLSLPWVYVVLGPASRYTCPNLEAESEADCETTFLCAWKKETCINSGLVDWKGDLVSSRFIERYRDTSSAGLEVVHQRSQMYDQFSYLTFIDAVFNEICATSEQHILSLQPTDCLDKCSKDSECSGFHYNAERGCCLQKAAHGTHLPLTQTTNSLAKLKILGARFSHEDVLNQPSKWLLLPGLAVAAYNLEYFEDIQMHECESICLRTAACVGFLWGPDKRQCYFKTGDADAIVKIQARNSLYSYFAKKAALDPTKSVHPTPSAAQTLKAQTAKANESKAQHKPEPIIQRLAQQRKQTLDHAKDATKRQAGLLHGYLEARKEEIVAERERSNLAAAEAEEARKESERANVLAEMARQEEARKAAEEAAQIYETKRLQAEEAARAAEEAERLREEEAARVEEARQAAEEEERVRAEEAAESYRAKQEAEEADRIRAEEAARAAQEAERLREEEAARVEEARQAAIEVQRLRAEEAARAVAEEEARLREEDERMREEEARLAEIAAVEIAEVQAQAQRQSEVLKDYVEHAKYDIIGSDLSMTFGKTVEECAISCNKFPECTAFTHVTFKSDACMLKKGEIALEKLSYFGETSLNSFIKQTPVSAPAPISVDATVSVSASAPAPSSAPAPAQASAPESESVVGPAPVPIAAPLPPPPPPPPPPPVLTVTVKYDYGGDLNAGALKIEKGEVLEYVDQRDASWSTVRRGDEEGIVPTSYVTDPQ